MADMTAAVVVSLIDEFSANGKKFKKTMTSMKKSVREFAGGVKDGIGKELLPRFDTEGLKKQIDAFDTRIARSKARLTGAVASAIALAAPLVQAAQFDQAFKGFDLKQLRKFALETSALVPIAARDVVELMSEAAQGGVPVEELEKFSLFTAKAAIAFDMAGALIGERFVKLRNGYLLNQDGIEKLADATNFLSNNFAAKAREITAFTNKASGAANILKMSAVEMSAVGAAMIASGVEPLTAARGLDAFANRVNRGGKKVAAGFELIGTNLEDFRSAVKKDGAAAFTDLFKSLSKSEQGMRALLDLVGMDFTDDFAKLLSNPELLSKTLAAVADRTKFDGSVVEEAAKQATGAVKKWELMVNKLSAASIQMGDVLLPKLLAITDAVGGMVASFSQFATENPELTSMIINTAAALLAFSIAAKVMSFAWAIPGKKLFEGLAFFTKLKGGKNVSKLASALMALPGPLKAIGLMAVAAGAAYAFFGDDTKRLRETMAKDPEGFKVWRERLFGVKEGADAAANALGRVNKADLAIRLNNLQKELNDGKSEILGTLEDSTDSGFFDSSADDFSASGKGAFGPVLEGIAKKIKAGTLKPEDVVPFRNQMDEFFSKKQAAIDILNEKISKETAAAQANKDFSRVQSDEFAKILKDRDQLQGDFKQDEIVKKLVENQLIKAVKLFDGIAQTKTALAEQKARDKQGRQAKETGNIETEVTGNSATQTSSTAFTPRDTAGRAALKKELEEGGDAAGRKLGKAATVELDGMASKIGAQIGKAAAAEMKKVRVQINNSLNTGTGARDLARAKSGALHDGVD